MDKGLLASHEVERLLGRFTRLRTPLGLVMRQLSADCDRETGCIPQCHLVLSGYVGSDRRVLIAYHDGFSLSPSVSTYPSIYLPLRLALCLSSVALALPSPAR